MESQRLITAYFEADHDRLDSLFRHFQLHKRSDMEKAKSYFRVFLQGLKRHIVWEEEVLFPFFEGKSGMPQGTGPTAVMRSEHRQIEQTLEAIHEKVHRKDPGSDPEEKVLLEVLGAHNMKEENILYPAIDQAASPQDAADIFRAMENVPQESFAGCCGS